jgi:hypothetical protein
MRLVVVIGAAGAALAMASPLCAQGFGNEAVIVDQHGRYHGNANSNQFDPNSVSNQFGRYGSQFSPDSINNQFGAGSPYNGNRYHIERR